MKQIEKFLTKMAKLELGIAPSAGYMQELILEARKAKKEFDSLKSSQSEIRNEMDADMQESGVPQGEIVGCLNHWKNKYMILRQRNVN